MKSIEERRDEYHVTIATLLGCEIQQDVDGRLAGYESHFVGYWRYRKYIHTGVLGWSLAHVTPAEAAREWLIANNHDLNGWQNDQARTHGEESNPAGN